MDERTDPAVAWSTGRRSSIFDPDDAFEPPAVPAVAPRPAAAASHLISPISRFGGLPGSSPSIAPPPVAPSRGSARGPAAAAAASAAAASAASSAAATARSASERFSAWRAQVRQSQRPEPIAVTLPATGGLPAAHADPRQTWRDEVVTWSRAVIAGALEHNPPAAPPIEALIARFELARQLQPALILLYGAHLIGERGAAPVDVARVLDRQWPEALGRGELADRAIATYLGSRVALAPIIQRVLDELPPVNGILVGAPGAASSLLGPCIVIAGGGEPLTSVAERCLSRVGGAVLAGYSDLEGSDLVFEARAYGAAPMVRPSFPPETTPTDAAIFVLDDADLADQLALPRLA